MLRLRLVTSQGSPYPLLDCLVGLQTLALLLPEVPRRAPEARKRESEQVQLLSVPTKMLSALARHVRPRTAAAAVSGASPPLLKRPTLCTLAGADAWIQARDAATSVPAAVSAGSDLLQPPPPGTRVTVRFSDGVDYPGTIAEALDETSATVQFDDGIDDVVKFPDPDVTVFGTEPEIIADCIPASFYEENLNPSSGRKAETMAGGVRRRLTPAQQVRRIFTAYGHQASDAWQIEENFRACSCNSLFAMLAKNGRVESMLECRYGPPCTGRNHIIALDKDKVVETVDGWVTYCLERQAPPWAIRLGGGGGNTTFSQGDIAWAAAKIDVPADSPLAAADVVVRRSYGATAGCNTNASAIQEAPVSDSEWI